MEGKADHQKPDEEFEPFCKWERNEDRDTIEIHLQEFKKDELTVQHSNRGILKISGERQIDASTKSKFYKEVAVPINIYDTPGIHAKFITGCLYITMPRRKSLTPETNKTTSPEEPKIGPSPGSEDRIINRSTSAEEPKIERTPGLEDHFKTPHPNEAEGKIQCEFQDRRRWELKLTKVAVTLAATAVAVAVMVAYVVYMYKATVGEVDD